MIWITFYGNKRYMNGDFSKESFKRFYDAWYARIDELSAGPMEGRILVFNVKEGWASICFSIGTGTGTFLGTSWPFSAGLMN